MHWNLHNNGKRYVKVPLSPGEGGRRPGEGRGITPDSARLSTSVPALSIVSSPTGRRQKKPTLTRPSGTLSRWERDFYISFSAVVWIPMLGGRGQLCDTDLKEESGLIVKRIVPFSEFGRSKQLPVRSFETAPLRQVSRRCRPSSHGSRSRCGGNLNTPCGLRPFIDKRRESLQGYHIPSTMIRSARDSIESVNLDTMIDRSILPLCAIRVGRTIDDDGRRRVVVRHARARRECSSTARN